MCDQATTAAAEESNGNRAWGKKITFRKAVHTIVTGQRIHNEITVRPDVSFDRDFY